MRPGRVGPHQLGIGRLVERADRGRCPSRHDRREPVRGDERRRVPVVQRSVGQVRMVICQRRLTGDEGRAISSRTRGASRPRARRPARPRRQDVIRPEPVPLELALDRPGEVVVAPVLGGGRTGHPDPDADPAGAEPATDRPLQRLAGIGSAQIGHGHRFAGRRREPRRCVVVGGDDDVDAPEIAPVRRRTVDPGDRIGRSAPTSGRPRATRRPRRPRRPRRRRPAPGARPSTARSASRDRAAGHRSGSAARRAPRRRRPSMAGSTRDDALDDVEHGFAPEARPQASRKASRSGSGTGSERRAGRTRAGSRGPRSTW